MFGEKLITSIYTGTLCIKMISGSPVYADELRPNILIFLTDDMGSHLGALGTKGLKTPVFDQLAESGILFTLGNAPSAISSPARTTILSGMYASQHGVWRNVFPLEPTNNSEIPNEARNALLTNLPPAVVHEVDRPAHWWPAPHLGPVPRILDTKSTLNTVLKDGGYYLGMTQKHHIGYPNRFPFDYFWKWGTPPNYVTGAQPSNYVGMKDFLKRSGNAPFFLFANLTFTHRPYHRFERLTAIERTNPADVDVPPTLPDTQKTREDIAAYYDTIRIMDEQAGEILAALRDSGRLDNTIIIFMPDQGAEYNRGKCTVYEGGITIPIIISGPGIQSRGRVDEMISQIDLAPTLIEMAGLPAPVNMTGYSFKKYLSGEMKQSPRKYSFGLFNQPVRNLTVDYPSRSIRNDRYKYILNTNPERTYELTPDMDTPGSPWFNIAYGELMKNAKQFPVAYESAQALFKRPKEEFYDLQSDPYELNNLIEAKLSGEQQQILNELKSRLKLWMDECSDQGNVM